MLEIIWDHNHTQIHCICLHFYFGGPYKYAFLKKI